MSILASEREVGEASLLTVDLPGDLVERGGQGRDLADTDAPGLRDAHEDSRPHGETAQPAGVQLTAAGRDEPELHRIYPRASAWLVAEGDVPIAPVPRLLGLGLRACRGFGNPFLLDQPRARHVTMSVVLEIPKDEHVDQDCVLVDEVLDDLLRGWVDLAGDDRESVARIQLLGWCVKVFLECRLQLLCGRYRPNQCQGPGSVRVAMS